MQTTNIYQELIIDHGTDPRNFKKLSNYNYQAESYNPLCGDQVQIFLLIEDQRIIDASFQGQGCAIAVASASIMLECIIGKTITYAAELFAAFLAVLTTDSSPGASPSTSLPPAAKPNFLPTKVLALIGVKDYPARVKCATLAWHTLRSILEKL